MLPEHVYVKVVLYLEHLQKYQHGEINTIEMVVVFYQKQQHRYR